MHKKYGIDVDGVLADFTPRMRSILNTLFDLKLPDNYVPSDWAWTDAKLDPHMMEEAWKVIKATPNFWEESLPINNNIYTMANWFKEHADHDAEVYFITSRVETEGRNARLQSENWLRKYLAEPKQSINVIVTTSGKLKRKVLEAINIHYFIDDHAPSVEAALEVSTCKSILLDQPWNRDCRNGLTVVNSLAEFFRKVS